MQPIDLVSKNGKEVQKLIDKSGNGFHSRVVKLLREMGWAVLVSPYYNDNVTDKPREIDIIAEKRYDVKNRMEAWLGTINVRIFVECKYIGVNTVFWFDNKNKEKAIERAVEDSGLDSPDHNVETNLHHYIHGPSVAKLFISESTSEERDPIYKALNQSINAMIYHRYGRELFSQHKDKRDLPLCHISYPLIVTNSFSSFFGKDMTKPDDTEIISITDPFQLEVSYAYLDREKKSQNEYFLIDVLTIDGLSGFISMLEKADISLITNKLSYTCDPGTRGEREC